MPKGHTGCVRHLFIIKTNASQKRSPNCVLEGWVLDLLAKDVLRVSGAHPKPGRDLGKKVSAG